MKGKKMQRKHKNKGDDNDGTEMNTWKGKEWNLKTREAKSRTRDQRNTKNWKIRKLTKMKGH